jgi:hypothetical protein
MKGSLWNVLNCKLKHWFDNVLNKCNLRLFKCMRRSIAHWRYGESKFCFLVTLTISKRESEKKCIKKWKQSTKRSHELNYARRFGRTWAINSVTTRSPQSRANRNGLAQFERSAQCNNCSNSSCLLAVSRPNFRVAAIHKR